MGTAHIARFLGQYKSKGGSDIYAIVHNYTQRICKFYLEEKALIFWKEGIYSQERKHRQTHCICLSFLSFLLFYEVEVFLTLAPGVGTLLSKKVPFICTKSANVETRKAHAETRKIS